jgi:hypothetical protein
MTKILKKFFTNPKTNVMIPFELLKGAILALVTSGLVLYVLFQKKLLPKPIG